MCFVFDRCTIFKDEKEKYTLTARCQSKFHCSSSNLQCVLFYKLVLFTNVCNKHDAHRTPNNHDAHITYEKSHTTVYFAFQKCTRNNVHTINITAENTYQKNNFQVSTVLESICTKCYFPVQGVTIINIVVSEIKRWNINNNHAIKQWHITSTSSKWSGTCVCFLLLVFGTCCAFWDLFLPFVSFSSLSLVSLLLSGYSPNGIKWNKSCHENTCTLVSNAGLYVAGVVSRL